jgi:hypothetical protein
MQRVTAWLRLSNTIKTACGILSEALRAGEEKQITNISESRLMPKYQFSLMGIVNLLPRTVLGQEKMMTTLHR